MLADLSAGYPEDEIMQLTEIVRDLNAMIKESNDEPVKSRALSLKKKVKSAIMQFEARFSDWEYEQRMIAD